MTGPETESVSSSQDVVGDGPLWDPRTDTLAWVDIERRMLDFMDESNGVVIDYEIPRQFSCLGLTEYPGRFEGGSSIGFHSIDLNTGHVTVLVEIAQDPRTRLNDGKPAPDGSWVNTSASQDRVKEASKENSVGLSGSL